MEIELNAKSHANPEGVEALRAKTSLRLQYEAQAQVLRRQMGGLLGVQEKLGFSARKICQLLMVDPSAWSRWMKDEASVPPHVWRSLQWYFALQDKIPGLNAAYFLGRDTRIQDEKWQTEVEALRMRIGQLERASKLQVLGLFFSTFLAVLLTVFLYLKL